MYIRSYEDGKVWKTQQLQWRKSWQNVLKLNKLNIPYMIEFKQSVQDSFNATHMIYDICLITIHTTITLHNQNLKIIIVSWPSWQMLLGNKYVTITGHSKWFTPLYYSLLCQFIFIVYCVVLKKIQLLVKF